MSKVLWLATLMMVLVLSTSTSLAQAQQDTNVPDCVNELDPCGPFINSTTVKPPAECCQPLASVLENDVACICSIFSSVELIQSLSLNVTQALTLPQRCGIQFDITAQCQALAPSEAPSMAPAIGLNEVSGAVMVSNVIASTESIILGSFLIWVALMFY